MANPGPRAPALPITGDGWQEHPPCVEVSWTDAHSMRGWRDREELEADIAKGEWRCTTAGWLIYADPECVIVCSQRAENGTYDEVMRIPRGMITRVRRLEELVVVPHGTGMFDPRNPAGALE